MYECESLEQHINTKIKTFRYGLNCGIHRRNLDCKKKIAKKNSKKKNK